MKLASWQPGEINNPVLKGVNGRWWERKSVKDMHKYLSTQKPAETYSEHFARISMRAPNSALYLRATRHLKIV